MSPCGRLVGFIASALLVTTPAHPQQFIETFSTTTFRDGAATTAWWDTGTGTLRLPPREITLVGSLGTSGAAHGVAVDGDRAYVADGTSGLRIVDIRDPASPAGIGGYNPGGDAWGVAIAGDWCYLTTGNVFRVVGVASPLSPILLDSYTAATTTYGLAVSRPYAYIANGDAGLLILDVEDPTNVTYVGSLDTPGSAIAVAVAGDLAFVADRGAGLRIVNVRNPTSPTAMGSYDTPGDAWGIAVDGDLAFVGDAASGVHVLDITNPYFPVLRGTCDTPGSARGIEVAGDRIYVADYGAVHAIDVSDPTTPTLVGTHNTPGIASDVALQAEYAFVADGAAGGLQILGVRDRVPDAISGTGGSYSAGDCAVPHGRYLYVGRAGHLEVYDIDDPWSPVLAGTFPAITCWSLDVDGDLAYTLGSGGLSVLNLQNPVVPVVVGSLSGPSMWDVVADGDYLYIIDDAKNLEIVNVADPSNPTWWGSCPLAWTDEILYDVAVSGAYAYVASGYADLKIVNIVFPESPFVAATASVGYFDEATGVAVTGDLALVAANSLWIFDITNPVSPVLLSELDLPHDVVSVAISGNHAFVAACTVTYIVDISNPAAPFEVDWMYGGAGDCDELRLHGDFVFKNGLPIQVFESALDVAKNRGQSLTVASTAQDMSFVRVDVTMLGGRYPDVSVSADGGVHWEPVSLSYWETLQYPGRQLRWRMDLNHGRDEPMCTELWFYWASASDVSDLAGTLPGECALLPVAPNPWKTTGTIRFALPRREHAELSVFDVAGRRIATLAEGVCDAGITEIPWDAQGDDGRPLAGGTYFIRLRAGGREVARKVVLRR